MSKYKVSFDKDGNHFKYDNAQHWKVDKQVDNYEFEDVLQYFEYERGRSALNIKWKSANDGRIYYSGMTMLNDILMGNTKCVTKNRIFTDNQPFTIIGRFTFQKQGTSVLLKEIK